MEERFRAEITATTNLGAGVAHAPDGRVVFVACAVKGDIADIVITKAHASYCEANIAELITPSPHRVTPPPCFDAGCGGCVFRHVAYEHELEVKSDYIRSAMKKCGIDISPEPFLTAGEGAVRSKVTVPVGGGISGYYARASHDIVPSSRCMLHDEETDAIRTFLAGMRVQALCGITVRRASEGTMLIMRAPEGGASEWGASKGGASKVNTSDLSELRRAALSAYDKFPALTSVFIRANGRYEHTAGDAAIYDTLAGCRFKISPDSFYQVNHACAELLYARAISAASLSPGESAADLYCGTGTIGIAAVKGKNVRLTGIEINASAVEDARENAYYNGVDAEFILGDAASYGGYADCVFIDPPRAGCGAELIRYLCKSSPSRIVYVSCNPSTLARDAARLSSGGYRIVSLTPVDMFPRTGHVECVLLMSRE